MSAELCAHFVKIFFRGLTALETRSVRGFSDRLEVDFRGARDINADQGADSQRGLAC